MTKMAAEANSSSEKTRSIRNLIAFREIVSIGATGAPTFAASDNDDPAITISRSATGAYSLTFPAGRRVWIDMALQSAAKTVVAWCLTASSASAGTATFKTLAGVNAAVDTDPANGDKLLLSIEVEV